MYHKGSSTDYQQVYSRCYLLHLWSSYWDFLSVASIPLCDFHCTSKGYLTFSQRLLRSGLTVQTTYETFSLGFFQVIFKVAVWKFSVNLRNSATYSATDSSAPWLHLRNINCSAIQLFWAHSASLMFPVTLIKIDREVYLELVGSLARYTFVCQSHWETQPLVSFRWSNSPCSRVQSDGDSLKLSLYEGYKLKTAKCCHC